MGCVWKGCDQNRKIVAIKMMSNQLSYNPLYRELFYNEVQALKKMDHPSVVHILGDPYMDEAGNLFLPMEYVDGVNLEKYVLEHGAMSEDDAIRMMIQILDAMQYVHEQGCIHRDIKPANIMVRKDGNVCIIDFGIAKDARVGSSGETVGKVIGTDGYMSPEQANGLNVDLRTDIYSLGCLLYFMFVGEHAIATRGNEYNTIQAILKEEMPLPSSKNKTISPEIDRIFRKAVDKNMTLRFQSAKGFKTALNDIIRRPPNGIPYPLLGPQGGNPEGTKGEKTKESHNFGWAILSLLLPFVGWFLYGVWRDNKPKLASEINIMASIGFSVYVVALLVLLACGVAS